MQNYQYWYSERYANRMANRSCAKGIVAGTLLGAVLMAATPFYRAVKKVCKESADRVVEKRRFEEEEEP